MGDSIPPGIKPTAIGLGSGAGAIGLLAWGFMQALSGAQTQIGTKIDGVATELRALRADLGEGNKQALANANEIKALRELQAQVNATAEKERTKNEAAIKELDGRLQRLERIERRGREDR